MGPNRVDPEHFVSGYKWGQKQPDTALMNKETHTCSNTPLYQGHFAKWMGISSIVGGGLSWNGGKIE